MSFRKRYLALHCIESKLVTKQNQLTPFRARIGSGSKVESLSGSCGGHSQGTVLHLPPFIFHILIAR